MEFCAVTTSDGLRLQGMLFKSKVKSSKLVIHVHGMASNPYQMAFAQKMAEEYPKAGVDFLMVETRGTEIAKWFFKDKDKPQLLGNAFELFEDCIHDIDAWVTFAKSYKEIHLQAHSLGCCKITYYYTQVKPKKVKSLIFISPADVQGFANQPSQVKMHEKLLKEAKFLKNTLRGRELLKHIILGVTVLSANTYLSLLGEHSKAGIFNFHDPDLGFQVLSEVDVPMFMVMGTKDAALVSNPHRSLELLKREALNSSKVQGIIYEGAGHIYRGYEEKVAKDVLKFLKSL
jgi:pimeloyl-ACP methyl ester carboxylesterase